ncbi:MAG: DUF4476 domain-containing protein [Myxococcales bacterium]|nr:DUF4476 domain-containing protein [Myxococcales bacterium]
MLTRFALPALAAAAALIATAPLVHESAQARPTHPVRPMPPPDHGGGYNGGGFEQLRNENAALRAELAQYRTAVADGLTRLDAIARTSRDRRTTVRLRRTIDDLRGQLASPGRGWDDGGWTQPPPPDGWTQPQPQPPPGGWPQPPPRGGDGPWANDPSYGAMPAGDFQRLQDQLAAARFPSDQLALIGVAAPRNRFTVDQVIALMQVLAFDDARIEVAVLLAPRVIDGQRWHLVFDALQFSSSRDTLRQRVQP